MTDLACVFKWNFPLVYLDKQFSNICCKTPQRKLSQEEIDKHGIDVFQNSDYQIERRFEMTQGIHHHDCSACKVLEDAGMVSLRQSSPTNFAEKFKAVKDINDPRLISNYVDTLEIKIGNLCDLKCMYCGPHNSTQWAMEKIKYGEIKKDEYQDDFGISKQYENLFWEWFDKKVRHTTNWITFAGGEPLITPKFYDTMERILVSLSELPERKKQITIVIITNLNTPDAYMKKFHDLMKRSLEFFNFRLVVSMESIGYQSEYIRNGLDWFRFDMNFTNLLLKHYNDTEIEVLMATNVLSLPYVKQFFIWLQKKQIETKNTDITLGQNTVSYPRFQSPLILTPDFAKYVDDAVLWLKSNNLNLGRKGGYVYYLSKMADSIRNAPKDVKLRKQFYTWFKQYDSRRGLNFLNTFPLHKEFWEYCQKL